LLVPYNQADVVHLQALLALCYARLARQTATLFSGPHPTASTASPDPARFYRHDTLRTRAVTVARRRIPVYSPDVFLAAPLRAEDFLAGPLSALVASGDAAAAGTGGAHRPWSRVVLGVLIQQPADHLLVLGVVTGRFRLEELDTSPARCLLSYGRPTGCWPFLRDAPRGGLVIRTNTSKAFSWNIRHGADVI
jgi:hypothetical protein